MKLKKILLFIILFLVTGCTAEYNLVISDDKTITESITMLQPNSFWGSTTKEINEQLDWSLVFSKDETEPAYFYNQRKILGSSYSGAEFQYKFNADNFKTESEFLRNCFENYNFSLDEQELIITAYNFKCYSTLGNDFKLNVNITTNGEKSSGNYDVQNGNKYIWNFNQNDNIYIKLNVDYTKKDSSIGDAFNKMTNESFIIVIFVIAIGLVLGISALIMYMKNRKNNS